MAEITLTDPSHPSHLVTELQAMRRDEELFDFVIKGNEESFHIHSLVLASMSPVFKALVRSAKDDSCKKEATFPSIPDDILSMVIDFAYNGSCTFSGDELMDLVKAADYLQMNKLLKLCEEQVTAGAVLQPSNCISWLLLSDTLHLADIMTTAQKMMRTSFQEIIRSEDFNYLEMSELVQYLTDVREHGSHSDVLLDGVLQWVKHDAQNRAVHMHELFKLLHVSECSRKVLTKMIAENADLLEKEEGMYKMILSEVLTEPKFKEIGEGKTIIVLGGKSQSDSPNPNCWILQNNQLVQLSEVPEDFGTKADHSVCEIPGGMMLTGGVGSRVCMLFMFPIKLWLTQEPLPSTRSSHGSGYVRGKVFVIGGNVADVRSCSVDFMDMNTKKWDTGPELPMNELAPKVVSFNATLFVLLTVKCNLYNLNANKMEWSAKSPMPLASRGCSFATSEDRMFAAGGDENINCMYTPAADTWCCLTGPSLEERQGSLVYYNQKLYLLAGCRRDKDLTDVEEYDVATDKWTLTKWKLPRPMCFHHAFLVDVPQ